MQYKNICASVRRREEMDGDASECLLLESDDGGGQIEKESVRISLNILLTPIILESAEILRD